MNALHEILVAPFLDFAFMRHALVAGYAIALGCGPLGVILVLRRMSLVGDSMQHAVLPGVAVGFFVSGLSVLAMALGGLVAGLIVALGAGLIARATALPEDAAFGANFLVSVAIGVCLVASRGNALDLVHILFGNVLAVDESALLLVSAVATVTLLALAVLYRPLVADCFDPEFLGSVTRFSGGYHLAFLALLALNLVASFQALGSLMAFGLMLLPALAAMFWARQVASQMLLSVAFGLAAAYLGLVLSFQVELPSGPAIVLVAGAIYAVSLFVGREGSLRQRYLPAPHLAP